MIVGDKIEDRPGNCFPRGEHFHDDGILRKLIRLKERDHHLVICASVVGENKDGEVNDADSCENYKDSFLGGGHAAMIPFPMAPFPNNITVQGCLF